MPNNERELYKREHWPAGPWDNEPQEKIEWRHKGVPCLLVRGPMGAWCGYAAVGPDHPWFGAAYGDCVVGCTQVPQKPLEPIAGKPVSDSMQKMHMDRKNFTCREDWKPGHSPESIIEVHGGLTYSDKFHEGGKICHLPLAGEPETVWWFGFDCAHSGDLVPGMLGMEAKLYEEAKAKGDEKGMSIWSPNKLFRRDDVYREIPYVQAEVERLAEQLLQHAKVAA